MRAWIYSFHHHHTDYGIGKQVMITREDRMKLISFMAEVETDGLGVSCKFFTISYSTFGSVSYKNPIKITLFKHNDNIFIL